MLLQKVLGLNFGPLYIILPGFLLRIYLINLRILKLYPLILRNYGSLSVKDEKPGNTNVINEFITRYKESFFRKRALRLQDLSRSKNLNLNAIFTVFKNY